MRDLIVFSLFLLLVLAVCSIDAITSAFRRRPQVVIRPALVPMPRRVVREQVRGQAWKWN